MNLKITVFLEGGETITLIENAEIFNSKIVKGLESPYQHWTDKSANTWVFQTSRILLIKAVPVADPK